MLHSRIGYLLVCLTLLASAGKAAAMDHIVCTVDNTTGAVPGEYAEKICAAAAKAMNAQSISASEMKEMVQSASADSESRLHVVEVAIPSAREISFRYFVGTAREWRDDEERRFDDLHIDIVDTQLNDAAIGMFVNAIRNLSR